MIFCLLLYVGIGKTQFTNENPNTASSSMQGRDKTAPLWTIVPTRTCPPAKTMAFGGVEMGSENAIELAKPMEDSNPIAIRFGGVPTGVMIPPKAAPQAMEIKSASP